MSQNEKMTPFSGASRARATGCSSGGGILLGIGMLLALCVHPVAATEVTAAQIEREAAEIVRVYTGLRQIVNARAADESCKEMITQLVVPIWQQRDSMSRRELAQQLVTVYEALSYEFNVRAARNAELKKLYPHFTNKIVAEIVPLPRGYQR